MTSHVAADDRNPVTPREPGTSRSTLAGTLVGGFLGLLVGIIGVLVIWLIIFSRALAGDAGAGMPGFIGISEEGAGSVATVLEPTVLLAPLLLLIVGAVMGGLIGRRRRRRPSA